MWSKVVIFAVLAAVTRSSCAEQSSLVYGLTEEKSSHFHGIVNNQATTRSTAMKGFHPIFDVLEILTIKRRYSLQCKNFDISASLAAGLADTQTAADRAFDSMSDGTCAAAETARIAARQDFANAYDTIGNAIRLAASGNYTDVRTDFQPFFVTVRTSFGTFIARLFGALRACLNIDNADALAAVNVREIDSTESMYRVNDAIFNAIKVFASGTAVDSSAPGIVPSIAECRRRATVAVSQSVEQAYIPFRSSYLSKHLNKPELAADLTSDQLVQVESDTRYFKAGELIFDLIKSYLISVQLGLSDGCKSEPSVIDAAEAKAVEYYRSGLRLLMQSVPTNNLVSSMLIKTGAEFFNSFPATGAHAYFTGLRLALGRPGASYSQILSEIQATEDGLQAIFPNLITNMFTFVQLGSGNVQGIANYENFMNQAGHDYVENVFKGAKILAKACHGVKPVTQEDFDALETAKNGLATATKNLNSNVSFSRVSVINTLNVMPAVTNIVTSVTNSLLNPLNLNSGLGLNLG